MVTSKKAGSGPLRPSWLRARLARWPLPVYRLGLGFLLARKVMILTTRGRTTGKRRKTPLWYVHDGDSIYCFSGWGPSSDWLKNLKVDPGVLVQIGKETWETRGSLVQDPLELERMLHLLLKKYGRLVCLFYHLDRLSLVAFPLST